jgi:Ca2+-binding RTX toxin-like protein
MPTYTGNNQANIINGSGFADLIDGRGGSDLIDGGGGDDLIHGGDGADTIRGGEGNDQIFGDNGNDLIFGGLGNDILNGGSGNDTVSFDGNANAAGFRGAIVDLTAGTAIGGEGNDTLQNFENVSGSNFADQIKGSAGNNVLYGNGGNDSFTATLGIDTIDGGSGIDSVSFAGMGAVTANLALGTYRVNNANRGTMTGIEHLTGSANADVLTGNSGANTLDGRNGADIIAGGLGNDSLWGGGGSDRLIADGGDDILTGNYSFDGFVDHAADIFQIGANAGSVTISDFERGIDKLDLTAFGFDANGVSAYWSGSAVQSGFNTVLTLTGQNSEIVTICLQGVVEGHLLAPSDMINGSSSLIASPPAYPINGGNATPDVFVIDPLNGDVTIQHFENGLDKLDITLLMQQGWDGYLATATDGSAVLEFSNGSGDAFNVTLQGVDTALIDQSDYIF